MQASRLVFRQASPYSWYKKWAKFSKLRIAIEFFENVPRIRCVANWTNTSNSGCTTRRYEEPHYKFHTERAIESKVSDVIFSNLWPVRCEIYMGLLVQTPCTGDPIILLSKWPGCKFSHFEPMKSGLSRRRFRCVQNVGCPSQNLVLNDQCIALYFTTPTTDCFKTSHILPDFGSISGPFRSKLITVFRSLTRDFTSISHLRNRRLLKMVLYGPAAPALS